MYLKGRPISKRDLIDITNSDINSIDNALRELKNKYANQNSAIELNKIEDSYSLELRANLNDFVTFSGASSLGGNITATVLNQEYQIATIVNSNSYTVEAKDTDGATVTANASDTGNGGSAVVGTYQINVGLEVYSPSTGWSVGTWGSGPYGSLTGLTFTNQLRLWTHDNFGENLIINARGGGIYRWVENDGVNTRAVELSGVTGANLVPTVGLQVLTSEVDRHLIVLGADPISGSSRTGSVDPMLIAFSDQENELDFEPLTTNTAGSLRLSSGSAIIGGVKARQEILVWTDTSLYSMQFIGPPFTFGINLINEGVGLVGPKAAVTAPQGVYWMSYNNFYVYNGSVQHLPCSVHNYVFNDINLTQSFKIHAFTSDGTFVNNIAGLSYDTLLVAGGGGGGSGQTVCTNNHHCGGGGGAGGLVYKSSQTLTSGNKSIVIGQGGQGARSEIDNAGAKGTDTTAFGFTALGGGGGETRNAQNACGLNPATSMDGGSGGGRSNTSGRAGNATQPGSTDGGFGNAGGVGVSVAGGGGGGAGAAGQDANDGDGGAGKQYSTEFGTTYGADSGYFAGGGGGGDAGTGNDGEGGTGGGGDGVSNETSPGGNGTDGTGGGGGGGAGETPGSNDGRGGDGGNGIVLVKYDVSNI